MCPRAKLDHVEGVRTNKLFVNDLMIQQLLDHSDFRGQSHGYVSLAFQDEYTNENVVKEAKEHLGYAKATIIKMHKFVLNILSREDYKGKN